MLAAACGDDGGAAIPDAPTASDAPTDCTRAPRADDRTRYVVISHPYDADGNRSGSYEVLALSSAGELTRFSPPRTFEMARTTFGIIEFTPDAELGFVATEDGKLAAFRLDDSGMPTVLTPGMAGSFHASRVVVAPDGQHLWIVDKNTKENGGGIYGVAIGCDGTLTDRGNVIPADFPGAFVRVPGSTRAIIAARSIYDSSPAGEDVHQVVLDGDPPGRLGGGDVFGMEDAIVGGAAVTHDGAWFLAGDTSPVQENRLAIARVGDAAVTPERTIMPFSDPQGIVTSPFGHVAIATSTLDADKIFVLDRQGPMATWRIRGEVAYQGNPQLPADMVAVDRGTLRGRVLVSEVSRVRQLAFASSGEVTDEGSLVFGDGLHEIVGAIGVTP